MDTDYDFVQIKRSLPTTVSRYEVSKRRSNGMNNRGCFSINYFYTNGMSVPTTVVKPDGMRFGIPPNATERTGELLITVCITAGREIFLDVEALLNSSSPAQKLMGSVIRDGDPTGSTGRDRQYTLDFAVREEDLVGRGGDLYLEDMDIVLSTTHPSSAPMHPKSEELHRTELVEKEEHINRAQSFGYSLRIVDSQGIYGERFVNIHNNVYRVPRIEKSKLNDGVYLVSSGTMDGGIAESPKPVSRRYTFEEADEILPLYETIKEANTLGDVFAQRQKEIADQQYELKEREQELKRDRFVAEKELEEMRRRLEKERLADEQSRSRETQRFAELKELHARQEHERTRESAKRKDYYEARSHERKDAQEWVKFIPAVITGVLAAFVGILKFAS